MSENTEIITSSKNPVITMPKRVFPTIANYGTCRFHRGEQIICKGVAFVVQFVSAKKVSLKLIDRGTAYKIFGKENMEREIARIIT